MKITQKRCYMYNFICENILWRLLTTKQYGRYLMHLNIIKFKLSSKFKLLLSKKKYF